MKEFNSQEGGRFTFADDLINLQNLASAFTQIFDDCDNFVISGCAVAGNSVGEGFVYINGKIRQYTGGTIAPGSDGLRYLYETEATEQVPYASGGTKVGRTNYGVALSNTIPSPINGRQPSYIVIPSNGKIKGIKEAFFGKYALLLSPSESTQSVSGKINFSELATFINGLKSNGSLEIVRPEGTLKIASAEDGLLIEGLVDSRHLKILFGEGAIKLVNGTTEFTITDNGVSSNRLVKTSSINVGQVCISGNQVYQDSDEETHTLNINVLSPRNLSNPQKPYYVDTHIGNGLGVIMLSVIGSSNTIKLSAKETIFEGRTSPGCLIFRGGVTKNSIAYRKYMLWEDVNNEECGRIGFYSELDNTLEVGNKIGNIKLTGLEAVDLGPVIKEGGVLLSDKYVSTTTFEDKLKLKIDSKNAYTKVESDNKFLQIKNGLTPIVVLLGEKKVREQIGALGSNDLSTYVKSSEYLADMATTDEAKRKIRLNIGAASASDIPTKAQDSGWLGIGSTRLYARQVGASVYIQGQITTIHEGVAFTLPNGIEAPTHDVCFSYSGGWTVRIAANSRECEVIYCTMHGTTIPFTLTYMV